MAMKLNQCYKTQDDIRCEETNKLYFLTITDDYDPQLMNKFLTLVEDAQKDEVMRYRLAIDKKLRIFSNFLIRIIACEKYMCKNSQLIFERNSYGKPILKGFVNFHYNIAHTRNAIVIAVSNNPVGVDIEKIHKIDNEKIARRVFTYNEQQYVKQDISGKNFYEIWTKKEAYVKYIGKGLSLPINDFDVLLPKLCTNFSFFEIDKYVISIFSDNPDSRFQVIPITEEQMIMNQDCLKR